MQTLLCIFIPFESFIGRDVGYYIFNYKRIGIRIYTVSMSINSKNFGLTEKVIKL